MDTVMKMGQTSAAGSLQLFLGRVVSIVIMAVGAIVLGWFILPEDYGLYAVALIPATTILLFQDWGVGRAMARYCAMWRASDDEGNLRGIIVVGLAFETFTGLALTLVSVLMGNFIASVVFGKPESAFLITFASITILSTSTLLATQNVFVGFERMELTTLTVVCQAVIQSAVAPLLVYLGYGAFGAMLGLALGSVISGIISLIFLYFSIFRKLPHSSTTNSNISKTLKALLSYGIPLAIGTIFAGIITQFYSFMMASFVVSNEMIGNYKIATNFAVLLTFFTLPISTVLFPIFSKIDSRSDPQVLRTVFTSSVKYTALILVPAALAMTALSQPLVGTLYGNKWPYAAPFLALTAVGNVLFVFGYMSVTSLLSGVGETKLLMKLNLLSLFIGVLLAFLLVPPLGINGVITGSLFAGVPSMFIGLYLVWKRYGARVDFKVSAGIFFSSALAAITSHLFVSFLSMADWARLGVGAAVFLAVYLIATPLLKGISSADINSLRAMFSGLGVVSKLFEVLLTIVKQSFKIRGRQAENSEH